MSTSRPQSASGRAVHLGVSFAVAAALSGAGWQSAEWVAAYARSQERTDLATVTAAAAGALDPAAVAPLLGMPADAGSAALYQRNIANFRNFALAIAGLIGAIVVLAVAFLFMMKRYNTRLQAELSRLRKAQEHLNLDAAVLENMGEGVMVTDATLRIESVNPAFERITGYARAEAVGRSPKILFSGKHDESFFHELHERVDAQGTWRGEIWNRRRNGEVYPQRTSISLLRDADGTIQHYATLLSDNTVQHQLEARLREMTMVDGLTGIANRRAFDETLAREWARALRDRRPLSMAMADIDYFKNYNDRHGHQAGDHCLRQVAGAIAGCASRASDLAARYGGEEFAVILPELDAAAAAAVGERIRAAVAALAVPHGGSAIAAFVTISVGVATVVPGKSGVPADLIKVADRALYQAKGEGRNRVISGIPAASGS